MSDALAASITALLLPLGTAICFLVGLLIRNAILDSTITLSKQIESVNVLIVSHLASDTEKHEAIETHLRFSDGRIDRLEKKLFV